MNSVLISAGRATMLIYCKRSIAMKPIIFNPILRLILWILVLVVPARLSQAATPEFSGYMDFGKKSLFVFTNIESRSTSGWITLGQAFLDHKVHGFDPADEVVILEYQGKLLRIPLKGLRVVAPHMKSDFSELTMSVSMDGILILNGQPVSWDALDALFASLASTTDKLRVMLQQPSYPPGVDISRVVSTVEELSKRMRESGLKKGEMILLPPPARSPK